MVDAADAGATGIQTSLDGGPFSDATSVTVTGDGSHTIDARGSDGTEARTVVLVDATAPDATIAVPATVPQGTATRLQVTCTDRGSGVDSCTAAQDGIARAVGDLLDTSRVGTSTISVEVRDNAGNHRTVSATLTVVDRTPPVLTLPASVVADAPTPAGTTVSFTATAIDAVDGVVPVTCAPASGSTFAPGDTVVRCQASDHAGNVGSGSFTVHVRDYRDQIAKVRAEIAAAAATAPASTATRLKAALSLLDDAGKTVNWADGLRLLAPRGGLVYVDLELTLDVLQVARGSSVPAATLDDWSKRLTKAGDEIARTAVADAVLAHGTAAKITSAQKTLTLAQTAVAAGNLRLAVVDDAASWVLAEQAMKKLP